MGSSRTCIPPMYLPLPHHPLQPAEIVSKHGVISSCKIDYLNSDTKALRILEQQMEGQKYGSLNDLDLDTSVDHSHGNDALLRELWHWVCEETRY